MNQKKKILFVEDEKAISKVLELKLIKNGFLVTCAHDGEDALEKWQPNTFDLIILDLVMPKKDGFEVLASLAQRKNTTPIIVSSNLSQDEDLNRAKKLGATDYFIKSNTSLAQIILQVQKILS